ncbi:Protein kinase domain,Protein kinase-like domain,Protein kinase, ATP binding site,Serine/threonine- [Cinara cedri]|uniref:non-specific serine/threonine protein kinase n=1 Tax=Cinara cedri TaxID=506608 RepID=A0A5E4MJJ8_9HEMI|nr:Protein kinase domain,Protein kinase-like domain,Protein kinase, ATP binding site,Serine/threonine- [Cinara cedri]
MSKRAKTTPKEELPQGTVLQDTNGNEWEIQNIIGSGGFGYVYRGTKHGVRSRQEYAIKTENMESGPLFVERMFYLKNMKAESINGWKLDKKLIELPLPSFYGFGSIDYNFNKYRFIVIEKFDKDLEAFLKSVSDNLLLGAVINIIRQMIDALEYIHECGYVHWDIKSQNIFVGKKPKENHVYLGDFGMVTKYKTENVVPNKKLANNGTLEYIALDGHVGMHTRRADLESLMYNGLEWLKLKLPWKGETLSKTITSKVEMKDEVLKAGPKEKIYNYDKVPHCYFRSMKIIYSMEPAEKPDYAFLKKLLKEYKKEKKSSK